MPITVWRQERQIPFCYTLARESFSASLMQSSFTADHAGRFVDEAPPAGAHPAGFGDDELRSAQVQSGMIRLQCPMP